MAVSDLDVKALFATNGVTTAFTIPFAYQAETEVQVWERDATVPTAIVETLLVAGLGNDYTLTGASPPTTPLSTTVTFNTAPNNVTIMIKRVVPLTQGTEFDNTVNFYPETQEVVNDKLTLLIQQMQEQINRALKLIPTSNLTGISCVDPTANCFLQWNATADQIINGVTLDDFEDMVQTATDMAANAAASAAAAAISAADAAATVIVTAASADAAATSAFVADASADAAAVSAAAAASSAIAAAAAGGIAKYANLAAFPAAATAGDGAYATTLDTDLLYRSNGAAWVAAGGGITGYANFAAFPSAVTSGDGSLVLALDTDTIYASNGTDWLYLVAPGKLKTVNQATGNSDAIEVLSGDSTLGDSGQVNIGSGTADVSSGAVIVSSGSSNTADSGGFQGSTGQASAGYSGNVMFATGQGLGSGIMDFLTGDSTGDVSGDITFKTGNVTVVSSRSGHLVFETGTTPGTRGRIYFKDGTQGTAGYIWVSDNTTGRGAWTQYIPVANGGTGATTVAAATAVFNAMVGDSGSGGTKGMVPAPSAGDAAANKFLNADGTFKTTPASTSGIAIKWIETGGNSAVPDIYSLDDVYLFDAALAQELYGTFKVPTGYVAGNPLKLKCVYSSPDTSGNVLFTAVSTLLAKDATAFDATTNQRTSTNTAATLSATANRINEVILDISSTTGTINSVAIAPGDVIKLKLTRGTDTATSNARLHPNVYEVTMI